MGYLWFRYGQVVRRITYSPSYWTQYFLAEMDHLLYNRRLLSF